MANNTVNLVATLTVIKGFGGQVQGNVQQLQLTPANQGYIDEPQTIATGSWQAIAAIGTLASAPGMVMVRNTDSTGTVTLALDNAGSYIFATLLPGGFALLQPPSHTIYAEATTNNCVIQTTGTNL